MLGEAPTRSAKHSPANLSSMIRLRTAREKKKHQNNKSNLHCGWAVCYLRGISVHPRDTSRDYLKSPQDNDDDDDGPQEPFASKARFSIPHPPFISSFKLLRQKEGRKACSLGGFVYNGIPYLRSPSRCPLRSPNSAYSKLQKGPPS